MAKPSREDILAELARRKDIQQELASRQSQQQVAQPEAQGYLQKLMQMPGGQALSRVGQAVSGLGDIGLVKGFGYAYPRELQERFGGIQQLFGSQPRELVPETPTSSFGETVGRGLGSLAGNITAAAPIVAGTVAALPEMAVAAPILGAGLAGGLEKKGGLLERGGSALEEMIGVGAGLAAKPLARLTKASFVTPTNEEVGEILLKNYNKAHDYATGLLKQAGKEAKELGIDVLKTGRGTPLDKSFWSELTHNMDTSKATKELIKKAKTGDYEALRRLQSDVGLRQRKALSSDKLAEQDIGKILKEKRETINNYIQEHFENKGVPSISDKIKEGMNKYRELMYAYENPIVAKAIGPKEDISESLLKTTMRTSKPMKALRAANPELQPLHQIIKDKNTLKKLEKLGKGAFGIELLKGIYGSNRQPQNEFEQ